MLAWTVTRGDLVTLLVILAVIAVAIWIWNHRPRR